MNKILLTLSLATVMYGCSADAKHPFLERDYALADTMKYDHSVIDELRKIVPGAIHKLRATQHNEEESNNKQEALQFEYTALPDNDNTYNKVKETLKKKGYLLFKSEENYGVNPDKYAVLKTKDQFDILKFRATSGPNYDITTDSILAKLRTWYTQYPFEITGADGDWVEIHLRKLSETDAGTFAREAYEFCPDVVEQGTETIDNLVTDLLQTKTMFLWWD
jgi:hypothetical protein